MYCAAASAVGLVNCGLPLLSNSDEPLAAVRISSRVSPSAVGLTVIAVTPPVLAALATVAKSVQVVGAVSLSEVNRFWL